MKGERESGQHERRTKRPACDLHGRARCRVLDEIGRARECGVLGVLPGVIGSLQANEALKLALGIGEPLVGRLQMFDALDGTFTEISLRRDPDCPVCGDNPTVTSYIDYVEFCQGGRTHVSG